MTRKAKRWVSSAGRGRRLFIIIGGGVFGVLVIAVTVLSYQSRRASFCDSCHYMDPYVRHWKESSHADVECVKCHDYGLMRLTANAIKYATDTYVPRPKANVLDASCLNSECHDRKSLKGKIEYRNGIQFDHEVHTGHPMRGEELRCTSCHNQIVQYSNEEVGHMKVNDKACFVCHFKDAGQGEAITGCDACHGMPKHAVEHAGFKFNHEPYLKLNVACKQCHVKIVKGDGSVPEMKCYSCHVERSRTDVSREELHAIHVTKNGIDCYECHSDIQHGNFSMVSSLEISCEDCHLSQHNRSKQLYMGISGRDSLDMPSNMFMAQVSCAGCHIHLTSEGAPMAHQEKKEASRASCVTCHGENYDKMFDNWLEGSDKVLTDYSKYVKAARSATRSMGGTNKQRTAVEAALNHVEYNYSFVRDGKIPHNIRYSLYLLNHAADQFDSAMTAIDKNYAAPPRGSGLKPGNSCLTFCHGKAFNPEFVKYEGSDLPHRMHQTDLELGCENCHSLTEHGKTQINKTVCSDCH